ncbi:MAG: FadR/GntR family transcriptional regulator [Chloroflexi bacterium]|nr:FadR/GntR family transcriptional regulator [Chloroflexota bacterium]
MVRDYIKQYILDHNLSAGDPLPPETQLVGKLAVGRSSVREAIKALQSLGIVEVRHGDGLYVREYNFDPVLETIGFGMRFNASTLSEMAQIRFLLESAVIKDVVTKISTIEIEQLENIMEVWRERADNNQKFSDLDEEFHRTLYKIIENQTLIKFLEVFWIAFENLDDQMIIDHQPGVIDYENHRKLLDAVKTRDPNLAQERLMIHFQHLQDRISRGLKKV